MRRSVSQSTNRNEAKYGVYICRNCEYKPYVFQVEDVQSIVSYFQGMQYIRAKSLTDRSASVYVIKKLAGQFSVHHRSLWCCQFDFVLLVGEEEDRRTIKMSFTEKIISIMQKPGQDPVARDDVPWWMKYAGRGLGTVGSLIAIFLGAWNCASILLGSIDCLISGMWQMVAGFIVIMIEAPCCCLFIDFVQNLSDSVEKRPYWNRAAAYCLMALPPIIVCIGVSSIFGSGLIFATGVIYGLMALGRKGSRPDQAGMTSGMGSPQGTVPPTTDHPTTLVENPEVWRPT
ncbi:calcium channel flower isoform X2 [Hylaeus anthracinus]|uniref:calcium channel flower isoform X2 n=1 Tax=Hylaeus anthracinus TaxID=313031 RepID=UPI0023B901EA|nr:calcium channel flower isoform X2 [Hylaeus anthracinus]